LSLLALGMRLDLSDLAVEVEEVSRLMGLLLLLLLLLAASGGATWARGGVDRMIRS